MKRFITPIFYLFFLVQSFSQTTDFLQHTLYEAEFRGPLTIHTVDFDNDGDMDQIVDVVTGDNIIWFKNDGSQNYTQINIAYTCFVNNLGEMGVVDFDLDGDLDILKVCDTNIFYLENDGNQNFTTSTLVSANGYLNQFSVRDLDNDGDNDIITSNKEDEDLYWLENDGVNNFTLHAITLSFNEKSNFEVVDLDADGDLDIVGVENVYSTSIRVFWYENDGAQNFTINYSSIASTGFSSASSVIMEIVDLDGDGNLDVLAGKESSFGLYVFMNDGNEVFTADLIAAFGAYTYSNTINASDIDADGDIDIVEVNSISSTIFINDGAENFTSQSITDDVEQGNSFGIADTDNDGDLDINLIYSGEDDIFWYENEGNLLFTKRNIYDAPINNVQKMLPVDLDQDSDIDIITIALGAENLIWFENDGNESFNYTYISDTIGYVNSVSAVDLDNDGDMDVLTSSSSSYLSPSRVLWFENDGSQNFTEHLVDSDPLNISYCIQNTDINNDGHMDIITGGSTKLIVYTNDGNENFTEQVLLDSTISIINIVPFDIDLDGDIDFFPSVNVSDKIYWFENDGTGNFTLHEFNVSYSTYGQNECIIRDLDNDGDYDLIVSTASTTALNYWYKNDGNENFTEIPTLYSFDGSIHVNDINDDGYVDLVSNKGWYEADEFQDFTLDSDNSFWSSRDSYSIDIDNDGDFDLLTISSAYQRLTWYENLLYNNLINISVIPFVDENGNGIFDNTEYNYQNEVFEISPQALSIISSQDTTTIILTDTGLYTIEMQLDTALWLATTPTSVQVDVISEYYYETVYFGIQPKLDVSLNSDVTGMWPRCMTENRHVLSVENNGLMISNGYIEYHLDDSATLVNSIPMPDSINGQTLFYNFHDLPTSHSKTVHVYVDLPETIMNLYHTYKVYADTGQLVMVDSIQFAEMVRCSYDPNDKQVYPNYGDSGYVLNNDTELEYLIRFQNTGNDTAYVVELKDSLDISLDESTFRLISQSHPLTSAHIDSNRVLTFLFVDINLTDTVTNEAESHGFVKFGIKTFDSLSINTSIINEASIYFDHNPPIVTNSTLNTVYNCETLGHSIELTVDYPNVIVDIDEDYLENVFWMWNGDIIHLGTEGFTFTPDTVGDIDLLVHLENDLCTFDTTYSLYVNNIGIVEDKGQEQVSVFPNPTTDMCYVDLGLKSSEFKIRLSTITGKFLKEDTYYSTRMVSFELPEEKGVYLLEVIKENGEAEFVKVIKQ